MKNCSLRMVCLQMKQPSIASEAGGVRRFLAKSAELRRDGDGDAHDTKLPQGPEMEGWRQDATRDGDVIRHAWNP